MVMNKYVSVRDFLHYPKEERKIRMEQNERKKQWHQGFYGAAELEFRQDKDNLIFDTEHYLSKEPLRMDMLIIKKKKDYSTQNPIGHLFKKHNVIEYKSPNDGLTIDDLTKTVGYACLYKSLAEKTDEIPLSEITVSLIRERYPKRLMKALADNGYTISEYCPGIYYVTGNLLFATQIIVTNYLGREHQWLRVLSAHAKEEDIISFAYASTNLTTQGEHNNADAIYQVSVMANYEMYEELKRRKPLMCEALKLLMKNELDESMEKGMEKGIEQGRLDEIISSVLDGDYSKERGAEKLGIPIEEFDELLGRFPKNPA